MYSKGLFLAALVFFAQTSFADQKLNVNVPGGGAQDLLNMTSVPAEISDGNHDNTMQRACTTPHGRVIQENEPGYKDCMALAQGKKLKPSPLPSPN